jgi:hypothetical protein
MAVPEFFVRLRFAYFLNLLTDAGASLRAVSDTGADVKIIGAAVQE